MKSDIKATQQISIEAPVSKVWDALTRPEMIKKYFFGTETKTDWKPGSPIIFEGKWEGKSYQDKGTVMELKEKKMIRYNYWSSMSGIEDKPENYVVITYELASVGINSILTITQENIPDEKTKQHSQENWKMVMNNLKKYVEEGVATYE